MTLKLESEQTTTVVASLLTAAHAFFGSEPFIALILPALIGGFIAAIKRQANEKHVTFAGFGLLFISGFAAGVFIGPWVASVVPGESDQVAAVFVVSAGGSLIMEAIIDGRIDLVGWLARLVPSGKKRGPDDA